MSRLERLKLRSVVCGITRRLYSCIGAGALPQGAVRYSNASAFGIMETLVFCCEGLRLGER